MAKLFSVRIDEISGSDFTSIGKRMPLRTLEEVRDFLVEYTTSWKQLPPPPVEEIAAQFELQRPAIEAEEGPALPGTRKCLFTLRPYADSAVEHCITVVEMSGKLSALGERAVLTIEVPASGFSKRSCRVCGCTEEDCRQCIDKTGGPLPLGGGGLVQCLRERRGSDAGRGEALNGGQLHGRARTSAGFPRLRAEVR